MIILLSDLYIIAVSWYEIINNGNCYLNDQWIISGNSPREEPFLITKRSSIFTMFKKAQFLSKLCKIYFWHADKFNENVRIINANYLPTNSKKMSKNIYANYLATNLKNMSDFLYKLFADKSKENITIFNANKLTTKSNKYRKLLC